MAAYLLASLLAAPFHDVLSRRVEQLVTGDVRDEARPGWRGALGDAAHSPVMLGFGSAAFLTCLVPLLNLAAMPLPVVGDTLLAMRFRSASVGAPAQPRASEPGVAA